MTSGKRMLVAVLTVLTRGFVVHNVQAILAELEDAE